MTRRVGTAEAKARLSELIGSVKYGRERILIERHGRPVAALVPADDLDSDADPEHVDNGAALPNRPRGALALVGRWADVDDDVLDDLVRHIYEARDDDLGRPVDLDR